MSGKTASRNIIHQAHLAWQLNGMCSPLFLLSLLGRLGDLARALVGLGNALDDTDRDGLTHVAGTNQYVLTCTGVLRGTYRTAKRPRGG